MARCRPAPAHLKDYRRPGVPGLPLRPLFRGYCLKYHLRIFPYKGILIVKESHYRASRRLMRCIPDSVHKDILFAQIMFSHPFRKPAVNSCKYGGIRKRNFRVRYRIRSFSFGRFFLKVDGNPGRFPGWVFSLLSSGFLREVFGKASGTPEAFPKKPRPLPEENMSATAENRISKATRFSGQKKAQWSKN